MFNEKGITLIELLVVIAIIGILALVGVPELNRFSADYKARSAATDLAQHIQVTRAMAMREGRTVINNTYYRIVFDIPNNRYMMGFDGDGDNDLRTLNIDTFGTCKDTNNDRLPNGDVMRPAPNADIPECVRVVNLSNYTTNVTYGTGVCQGVGGPADFPNIQFDSSGMINVVGSVYFQTQAPAGETHCYRVRLSTFTGRASVDKWDPSGWLELR